MLYEASWTTGATATVAGRRRLWTAGDRDDRSDVPWLARCRSACSTGSRALHTHTHRLPAIHRTHHIMPILKLIEKMCDWLSKQRATSRHNAELEKIEFVNKISQSTYRRRHNCSCCNWTLLSSHHLYTSTFEDGLTLSNITTHQSSIYHIQSASKKIIPQWTLLISRNYR